MVTFENVYQKYKYFEYFYLAFDYEMDRRREGIGP